jgi:hypothetical protein
VSAPPPAKTTAGLIQKETNERPTSNIERPTLNIEFCQFKKMLNNTQCKGLAASGGCTTCAVRDRIDLSKSDLAKRVAEFG